MSEAIFEVLDPGFGLTIQDGGRHGWRRFGVPPSGAMDDHAAAWANRLLDNPDDAPVLELPLQGVRLRVLNSAWIAVTGANACPNIPMWRAIHVQREDIIHFPRNTSGVWIYLAVAGGFEAERWLGSASVYPRGLLGRACASGARLSRRTGHGNFRLPDHVAGRIAAFAEQRHYDSPPAIRVWPGPQWDSFLPEERAKFFSQQWTVTARSDRVGYRLAGEAVHANPIEILSEPVLVGSIQVPEDGQPIVTMRDGPTVGGYPKLGLIEPKDLSWLAQCRPSQRIRFDCVNEKPPFRS